MLLMKAYSLKLSIVGTAYST